MMAVSIKLMCVTDQKRSAGSCQAVGWLAATNLVQVLRPK